MAFYIFFPIVMTHEVQTALDPLKKILTGAPVNPVTTQDEKHALFLFVFVLQ